MWITLNKISIETELKNSYRLVTNEIIHPAPRKPDDDQNVLNLKLRRVGRLFTLRRVIQFANFFAQRIIACPVKNQ